MDVRADERVSPLAEVEVPGRVNGVADAAGLLNPKLKPVVDADVVAGVPVLKKNKQNKISFYLNQIDIMLVLISILMPVILFSIISRIKGF